MTAHATQALTLPGTWEGRAEELRGLLEVLAEARSHTTVIYARAFLDAGGTDRVREQTARLAAAESHQAAEYQAAQVAAYQLLLDAAARADGGNL